MVSQHGIKSVYFDTHFIYYEH